MTRAPRLSIYEEKSTSTQSTWRGHIEGYTPLSYPTQPSKSAWVRASLIRFVNGLAGVQEGEESVVAIPVC
jgi:hypothetical protein